MQSYQTPKKETGIVDVPVIMAELDKNCPCNPLLFQAVTSSNVEA